MRYLVSVGIITMLILSSVTIAQSEEDLAAAWLFNEDSGKIIKDTVGNLDGEVKGNLKRTDEAKFGRALEFPGTGESYVTIPHDEFLDSEPFTFTTWVKLEPSGYDYIAWKDGTTWPEQHNKRHIDIWVNKGPVVLMWHLESGGEGRVDGQTTITDNSWHHVAQVCDGTNMRLYIDGKLDNEGPIDGNLVVNGEDPLWIGARPGNVAATGIFDEVGFFTKALSEDELTNVMNNGLAEVAAVSPKEKLAITWGTIKM